MFTEWPLLERYAVAASAGFKGVEYAFPYDVPAGRLADVLADADLSLIQITAPMNWDAGDRGIATLPPRIPDFRRSIETAIEYAIEVECPLVHVMVGSIPGGLPAEAGLDTLYSNLVFAAGMARDAGVAITIEPVCRARFPDFALHRLDEAIELINLVGSDHLGLCFDTFHVQMEEGNLCNRLEQCFPYLAHVQIGNPPGRHEPGVGEIDLPFFLAHLEQLGWDRWVGCELLPSGPTLDSLSWARPYGLIGSQVPSLPRPPDHRGAGGPTWRDLA
jgi:2-dehydrotetronate isomerase